MSEAASLRAQARAIRAEAEARALALEAIADRLETVSTERGADWIPIRTSGLPLTTARRAVGEGSIRASRIGRDVYVSAEDVAKYFSDHAVRSASHVPEHPEGSSPDAFEQARLRARSRRAA